MLRENNFILLKILFVTLFLATRFSVGVHAAEFGDGPHKHDNKICAITLSIHDDEIDFVILPTVLDVELETIPHFYIWSDTLEPARVIRIRSKAREPPAP